MFSLWSHIQRSEQDMNDAMIAAMWRVWDKDCEQWQWQIFSR
ncbi:MAG: hypothetical protein ACJASC_001616 [Limimaricola cinnabarinus]|jgi:hypothetical protein